MESCTVISSSRKKHFGSSKTLLLFCTIELQKVVKFKKTKFKSEISLQKVKGLLNMGGGRYDIRLATPIFD